MRLIQQRTIDEATDAVSGLGDTVRTVFARLFSDTLDNAVSLLDDGTAFVVTGDIPAMWLRDSTTQLTPYLHFADRDEQLADTLVAVSRRQLRYLTLDPYANAFNASDNGHGHRFDRPAPSGWVWERKYEIDSLCYPLQLAHDIWRITGRTDHLGEFPDAAVAALGVIETEQHHEERSEYRFRRPGVRASDSLARQGRGRLTREIGLSWSAFRPSDDACELGFNVPGNAFAVVALRQLGVLARSVLQDAALADRAESLAATIDAALARHARVGAEGEDRLAYEIDGFGGVLEMDDANVPSLLSLPLLGWCAVDDPVYQRTRAFILSPDNPYFYRGRAARGVGSPHTPAEYVWPLALAVQGLTSTDADEKRRLVSQLVTTDGGTGFMHESFRVDDPSEFTRPWFSWANAMFCELALDAAGARRYVRAPLRRD